MHCVVGVMTMATIHAVVIAVMQPVMSNWWLADLHGSGVEQDLPSMACHLERPGKATPAEFAA